MILTWSIEVYKGILVVVQELCELALGYFDGMDPIRLKLEEVMVDIMPNIALLGVSSVVPSIRALLVKVPFVHVLGHVISTSTKNIYNVNCKIVTRNFKYGNIKIYPN